MAEADEVNITRNAERIIIRMFIVLIDFTPLDQASDSLNAKIDRLLLSTITLNNGSYPDGI